MAQQLEFYNRIPTEFGKVTNEALGLEIERSFAIIGEIPALEEVVGGIFNYLGVNSRLLTMLGFAVRKKMAVAKYENPIKFSTRLNLKDGVVTIVSKGDKRKVWGGKENREVVLVRPERKLVVPNGVDPLVYVRQTLLPLNYDEVLRVADRFLRNKVTGLIVDQNKRVYQVNVDQRKWVSGAINHQLEIEYLGNMLYAPRGRRTALNDICGGILRVSHEVVAAGEQMGLVLVPKDQSRGPLPSRRFK